MAMRKLRQNVLMGDGRTYTLCVAVVREKLPDGTPRKIELIKMDEKVDVRDPANREFVLCYLLKEMMRTPMATPEQNGRPMGAPAKCYYCECPVVLMEDAGPNERVCCMECRVKNENTPPEEPS